MPDVTPDGPIGVNLDALRTLISNVTYFQTLCGAPGDATSTLKHILLGVAGYNVFSKAVTSNVATIVTKEPHNRTAGDLITLEGLDVDGLSTLDGKRTVASVVDTLTLTFAITHADLAATQLEDMGYLLQTQRPFILLQPTPDAELSHKMIAVDGYVPRGSIDLFLDAEVSGAYANDDRNAKVEMYTAAGKIRDGIMALSGTADYMRINSIEAVAGETFIRKSEHKDNQVRFETWQACYRLTWGVDE